jgi:hypothetical protein
VVGAYYRRNGTGAAYVFSKASNRWKETGGLEGSDTRAGDQFGDAVAIAGSTVVVGAPQHGGPRGALTCSRELRRAGVRPLN